MSRAEDRLQRLIEQLEGGGDEDDDLQPGLWGPPGSGPPEAHASPAPASGPERTPGGREIPPVWPNLETALSAMQAPQLALVARRYHPRRAASRKLENTRAVVEALHSQELLEALVGRLTAEERALLGEVERHGGEMDGWRLVAFAVRHGLRPPSIGHGLLAYGRRPRRTPAGAFLAHLIAEGLLLPASTSASWFETYTYHPRAVLELDRVAVDPRLLERLPRTTEPPARALRLPRAGAAATGVHPAALVVELVDALHLVADEGGVPLTQGGAVTRRFLARCEKLRPYPAAAIERTLVTGTAMGLLRPPADGARGATWTVDVPTLRMLHRLPPFLAYGAIVEASASARDGGIDFAWQRETSSDAPVESFWWGALDALEKLPDHPVPFGDAAEALWNRLLAPALARIPPASDRPHGRVPLPDALPALLQGQFQRLGLVAIGDGVLAPALGARWYARARRLVRRGDADTPQAEEERQRLLDPEDGRVSGGPSFLIQPNFEVLAYLDRLDAGALALLACANVVRIDSHTATLTIERRSLDRALDLGYGLSELMDALGERSHGLPDNVAAAMRDWARRRERLRLTIGVRLLEYATPAERDAAVTKLTGATPIGERFARLAAEGGTDAGAVHHYDRAPARSLRFDASGTVTLTGPLDLPARVALARVALPSGGRTYTLSSTAGRSGAPGAQDRETLRARAAEGIPRHLEALLDAWSDAGAAPVVASVSVFRHPQAGAWAEHPKLRAHLGGTLNATTYAVLPGHEAALEAALEGLGVRVGRTLEVERAAGDDDGSLQPTASTRATRELIEAAIQAGHRLELRYTEERERLGRYGYAKRSKGRKRTELVLPEEVFYQGSIPYLTASTADRSLERTIRIGYVEAIAVRPGS